MKGPERTHGWFVASGSGTESASDMHFLLSHSPVLTVRPPTWGHSPVLPAWQMWHKADKTHPHLEYFQILKQEIDRRALTCCCTIGTYYRQFGKHLRMPKRRSGLQGVTLQHPCMGQSYLECPPARRPQARCLLSPLQDQCPWCDGQVASCPLRSLLLDSELLEGTDVLLTQPCVPSVDRSPSATEDTR